MPGAGSLGFALRQQQQQRRYNNRKILPRKLLEGMGSLPSPIVDVRDIVTTQKRVQVKDNLGKTVIPHS